jgi:hypothetical protein
MSRYSTNRGHASARSGSKIGRENGAGWPRLTGHTIHGAAKTYWSEPTTSTRALACVVFEITPGAVAAGTPLSVTPGEFGQRRSRIGRRCARRLPCSSRAPNGLTDRVKLRSCERPEARGGRIVDLFDRRATKGRDANPRFHDGRQTVRRSRPAGTQRSQRSRSEPAAPRTRR